MAQKAYGPSHAKRMCEYHVVFTPKYRRKVIYSQVRSDPGEIFRKLCRHKGAEIIEGHLMPDIALDRLSVKEYEDPFDRGPKRK